MGVNHLEGHIFANVLSTIRELRAAARRPCRLRRPHLARARARSGASTARSARRSTTRRERRSTRSPRSSGSAIRADRSSPSLPKRAIRAAIDFPRAMMHSGDYRVLALGTQDGGHQPHPPRARSRTRDRRPRSCGLLPAGGHRRAGRQDGRGGRGVRCEDVLSGRRCRGQPVAARAPAALLCGTRAIRLAVPPLDLCTDNAVMIAAAGTWRFRTRRAAGARRGGRSRPPAGRIDRRGTADGTRRYLSALHSSHVRKMPVETP